MKVKSIASGYSKRLGQLTVDLPFDLDKDVAGQFLRTTQIPNGVLIKADQDLAAVDKEIKKAGPSKPPVKGTIDLSDGVSKEEASLAGKALAQKKNKKK